MGSASVILMGLRCSGKSTLGPLLAARRGARFIELDDETARLSGHPSAGAALGALGESEFRRIEARALASIVDGLASGPTAVVALGGGTPTAPGAPEHLARAKAAGAVVLYLFAPAEVLAARWLTAPGDRPALTGLSAAEEVRSLLAQRHELYQSLADFTVISRHQSPEDSVRGLADALASIEAPPPAG
ncbi:MAG: hypothetical protein JNJ48_04680 [Phycisphaerae bacterium]|nr:hypothetical protein [Phycisphaerae bacterium]